MHYLSRSRSEHPLFQRFVLNVIEPVRELNEEGASLSNSKRPPPVMHLARRMHPAKCSLIWCNSWIPRPLARLTLQRTTSVSITSRFVYLTWMEQRQICGRYRPPDREPQPMNPFERSSLPTRTVCSFNCSAGCRSKTPH